jgi:choline-sulfatase
MSFGREPHMVRSLRFPTVVLAASLISACSDDSPAPPPNGLVIVTLDTTRADRLPAYGADGLSTEVLDRLVREGVVFNQAMSVAPLTLPAHASLFTGLYPPRHGVRDNAAAPLDARHATLAEILQLAGFRTAAFVGSAVLAANRGLARGFETYKDGAAAGEPTPLRRPGNHVADEAVAWLDAADASPFFLWVHLYDVHAPQTIPENYHRASGGDLYAGALAFADAQIGRIVEALERRHVLDSTAILVVADHGESLGEHGEFEHGIFLYEGPIRVPFIVRAPGLRPRRVREVVSLVDVMPTALDLLGKRTVPADGVTLVPALRGRSEPPERAVYAESMYAQRFGWSPLRMLRTGRFKFIEAPRPELYALDRDPFEEHNLAVDHPTLAAEMRAALGIATNEALPARSGLFAQRHTLAALGYLSDGPPSRATSARDPKDFIQIYNESRARMRR